MRGQTPRDGATPLTSPGPDVSPKKVPASSSTPPNPAVFPPQTVFDYHRTIVGYHGTRRATAARLVDGEPFGPSENDDDWLGHGVYFGSTRRNRPGGGRTDATAPERPPSSARRSASADASTCSTRRTSVSCARRTRTWSTS